MTRASQTSAKVVTISGVDRELVKPNEGATLLAKKGKRMAAYGLDALVFLPFFIVSLFTGIAAFLAVFLYFAFYNSVRESGRSLGRAAVGQRLMTDDGQEVGHSVSIARNLVRMLLWVMVIPFFVDLGLFLFGDGRLIADRIFRTRVVEDPELPENQKKLAVARYKGTEVEKVVEERERWDEAYDQDELESIVSNMSVGEDYDKDLDDFEQRLAESMNVGGGVRDPELDSFARRLQEATSTNSPEVRSSSTVLDFAHEEVQEEQEVAAVERR